MGFKEEINQSKFSSKQQEALLNVLYTGNWVRDSHSEFFKPFGIRYQHYNVMRIIKGSDPKPMCPGDIKNVMLDKSPDLTRLIDKLVNLGYLSREHCKENRRMVLISITEKGVGFVDKVNDALKGHLGAMEEKITDKEADALNDILNKLRQ